MSHQLREERQFLQPTIERLGMKSIRHLFALLAFLIVAYSAAFVIPAAAQKPEPQSTTEDDALKSAPYAVTHHQITIADKTLKYTATAGRILLKPEHGPTDAAIFFTAYTVDGADVHSRPLTFAFNGGPGVSTALLHMGALGPKKIKLEANGFVPAPPYATIENPDSILDHTDLVFIDAPGTGFSRVRSEVIKTFFSVPGDANAFYRFIRTYLTEFHRWGSPLFLLGESYGTFRAAALAKVLNENNVPLNGVALLSVGLDTQTVVPGNLNDLPYQVFVPSYTMIAAYHHKLAPELTADLSATIKEVEQWCAGDYAQALAQGNALPADKRKRIVQQLAAYTGLKPELIEEYDLRIEEQVFIHNLLKDQKLDVGRLDGRFTSPATSNAPIFDPAWTGLAINAVMNDYAHSELGYSSSIPYVIFDFAGINQAWDWGNEIGYPQTASALQSAMVRNKYLKVLVMEGMYDLATPFYASAYTFQHLRLQPDYLKNISFADYKGGHMFYDDAAVLKEMKRTLGQWYESVLPR
jgi:carboxypeptidase C (cathepsin A)